MYEPEHPRSSFQMNHYDQPSEAPEDSTQRRRVDATMSTRWAEMQRLIVSTYIVDGAPLQINVSERLRQAVGKRCPTGKVPCPGLFDECMSECEALIRSNYFAGCV